MRENPFTVGLPSDRRPADFCLVIFGVTGDLAKRKLLPALHSLYSQRMIDGFRLIGFARRPWTDAQFRDEARAAIESPSEGFLSRLEYLAADFDDVAGYADLRSRLEGLPNVVFYLATAPERYKGIIEALGASGLSREGGARKSARIIVEKPFGSDLASALALNDTLASVFAESQCYRIDHYVGKETVQNISAFRFGNGLFEPVWDARHIDRIEITVAERVGVETRGDYYEKAGALRDMVQNHMLQLLALVAMEPPNRLDAESIHDEKAKILRALKPFAPDGSGPDSIRANTVRAQYESGFIDGESVSGYREEAKVSPESKSETFVALRLGIDSWRWAGLPFILRTGKRMSRKLSEIAVRFKRPPLELFPGASSNTLVFGIQPDEGLSLDVNAKIPGPGVDLRRVNMNFLYGSSFVDSLPEAYERLLLDAFSGDPTLYTRRDEIEASWRFVQPILDAWASSSVPMETYRAGSQGPDAANALAFGGWRRL